MNAMHDPAGLVALPSRVQTTLDAGDLDAFADTMTQECTLAIRTGDSEYRFEGRQAIVALNRGLVAQQPFGRLIHFVGSIVPEIRGEDRAFVTSTCLYISPGTGFTLAGLGLYADDALFDRGVWRISRRIVDMTLGPQMAQAMKF